MKPARTPRLRTSTPPPPRPSGHTLGRIRPWTRALADVAFFVVPILGVVLAG